MLPMEKGLLPRDLVGFLIQAYEAKAVRICSVKDMLKALCGVGNWVHSQRSFLFKTVHGFFIPGIKSKWRSIL